MLLTELYRAEERKYKLDYLMEYLVVTDHISENESKQLIVFLERMHQDVEKQVESRFQKALANLTAKYQKLISDARKAVVAAKQANESPKIIQTLLVKIDNLKQSFSMARNNLIQRFNKIRADSLLKMKNSKTLVKLKSMPKGKIGAALALGTAAAGGGYMAYRARQKKLAAAKA